MSLRVYCIECGVHCMISLVIMACVSLLASGADVSVPMQCNLSVSGFADCLQLSAYNLNKSTMHHLPVECSPTIPQCQRHHDSDVKVSYGSFLFAVDFRYPFSCRVSLIPV